MIEDAPVIICGFPSPAEDYREDFLDFNSYLGCNRPSVYALRILNFLFITMIQNTKLLIYKKLT